MGAGKELWMAEMERQMEAWLACHPDGDEEMAHEAVIDNGWREGGPTADENREAKREYFAELRVDDLMREQWEQENREEGSKES